MKYIQSRIGPVSLTLEPTYGSRTRSQTKAWRNWLIPLSSGIELSSSIQTTICRVRAFSESRSRALLLPRMIYAFEWRIAPTQTTVPAIALHSSAEFKAQDVR